MQAAQVVRVPHVVQVVQVVQGCKISRLAPPPPSCTLARLPHEQTDLQFPPPTGQQDNKISKILADPKIGKTSKIWSQTASFVSQHKVAVAVVVVVVVVAAVSSSSSSSSSSR